MAENPRAPDRAVEAGRGAIFIGAAKVWFIVSGFVIYLPTVARNGDFGQVSAFAIRRAARLFPAYYIVLVLSLILLAAFGVFAIVAHLVTARRRELAVRMVLGATPGAILRMTIREGLTLTAIGLAVGTGGALAAGRSLGALTFGVAPLDPGTLLAVAAGTLTVGSSRTSTFCS